MNSAEGVNALELLQDEPANSDDFNDAITIIDLNFGLKTNIEKRKVLLDLILEAGWSKERLRQVTKYILKTKKFPNWTIADWFEHMVKLYPYSWYLEQVSKGVSAKEMEAYKVQGVVLWKIRDGIQLPFEKIN